MNYFEAPQSLDCLTQDKNDKIIDTEVESVYVQREILKNAIQKAKDLVTDLDDVPDRLKPALRLYFFNNIMDRNGQDPEGGYDKEVVDGIKRFKSFIENEKNAERDKVLPPIGIEIEIPDKFNEFTIADYDLFYATEDLGIPAGKDVRYEFAPQYSFSAKSQSMLTHELIRGGFIETLDRNGKKEVRGKGDFPLHINLGFPASLKSDENKMNFEKSADILANALTYAFSSPERLRKRIDRSRFKTQLAESPEIINKNRNFDDTMEEWQRLEIRSLEVRDATLYRLLSEAQLLGAALFRNVSTENPENVYQITLKNIWQEFEKNFNDIIRDYHVNLNDIDDSKLKSRLILKYTQLSNKMRNLITESSLLVKQAIKESSQVLTTKTAA